MKRTDALSLSLALPSKAEHMLTLAKLELARPGNKGSFKGMIINLANSKKQSSQSEGKLLTRALRKKALAYKRSWREKHKSFKLCWPQPVNLKIGVSKPARWKVWSA